MVNAWDGPDPVGQDDGNTGYELGVSVSVNEDITVTSVRVWHPTSSVSVVNRAARFWTTLGVEVQAVLLDDTLSPGWSTFELDDPLELTEGSSLILSYSTTRYYGAVSGSFPNGSADGAVTYTGGLFRETFSPAVPNSPTASFYGIDLGYELGIGGNVAPSVTVTATAAGRLVTAVAVVDDEAPGSVTYRWEWGDGQVTADGAATEQHTYAADGLYAVLVTVTDTGGLKDSAAAPVLAATGNADGLELAAVMRALGERLDTVSGLNVYVGWPDKVIPPAAIVALPADVTYDVTYRRGADRWEIPVIVAVRMDPLDLDALSAYVTGGGARSVKAVLESGVYEGFADPHVSHGEFDVYTFADKARHVVAVFDVTVTG